MPPPRHCPPPSSSEIHEVQSPPLPRRRSRLDEAAWYLDSDDSSSLGSPSTPPMLNGEWFYLPHSRLLLYSCGYCRENYRKLILGSGLACKRELS